MRACAGWAGFWRPSRSEFQQTEQRGRAVAGRSVVSLERRQVSEPLGRVGLQWRD
jgi:hypothetical protein